MAHAKITIAELIVMKHIPEAVIKVGALGFHSASKFQFSAQKSLPDFVSIEMAGKWRVKMASVDSPKPVICVTLCFN